MKIASNPALLKRIYRRSMMESFAIRTPKIMPKASCFTMSMAIFPGLALLWDMAIKATVSI